jgi:hypothetical protein
MPRIDDHERPLRGVDLDPGFRLDAQQHVVGRPRQLAPVHHQLGAEHQDRWLALLVVLDRLVAALAHDVPEQDLALGAVDEVVDRVLHPTAARPRLLRAGAGGPLDGFGRPSGWRLHHLLQGFDARPCAHARLRRLGVGHPCGPCGRRFHQAAPPLHHGARRRGQRHVEPGRKAPTIADVTLTVGGFRMLVGRGCGFATISGGPRTVRHVGSSPSPRGRAPEGPFAIQTR